MTFSPWQKIRARLPDKVPLRSILIVPLVLQVISMVGIVGYFSHAGAQRSVESIANALLAEKSDRFNHDMYVYWCDPILISPEAKDLIQQGLISPEDLVIVQQLLARRLKFFPLNINGHVNGHAFVVNRRGQLIASSSTEIESALPSTSNSVAEIASTSQRILATNSRDRRTRQIANHLSDRFNNLEQINQNYFFRFEDAGSKYFVKVFPLQRPQDSVMSLTKGLKGSNLSELQAISQNNLDILQKLDLLTIIAIDEAAFTSELSHNTNTIILLCGIAAILAIVIGSITSDWIIQPILQLNAVTKQISNIYFVKPKSQTRIQEIQELNNCFVEMTEHLQSSFESLVDQKLYVSNLLEAMPIGVAIHSADGALTYLNDAGQSLLKTKLIAVQASDNLHSTFQIYIANTDQLYPVDQLPSSQAIAGKTCYLDNLEIVRRDERIPLEAKAAPVFSIEGKVNGAVVVFRDISDRKKTEKILADYNRKLEQDVQQRTLDLQQEIQERQQAELALRQIEIELTNANQELARLASIDGLTKIANRRGFDDRLQLEWRRMMRESQPLALLLFDVDYFKLYNDHYGHQLGDRCLEKLAETVNLIMRRPADMVARYGGEEFVVILPNTNLEGAAIVADLIHQAIRKLAIPHQRSLVSEFVSVSLGISCFVPTLERSPDILISQADRALYNAKQQGRNCSKIFDEH